MKGINTKQSAVAPDQRQGLRDATASSTRLRATHVASPAEVPTLSTVGPEVDRAKVERLRLALEAGELKFDSAVVAQGIIDQGELVAAQSKRSTQSK